MKVLWITNVLFPEVRSKLIGTSDFKSSGGWVLGAAGSLVSQNGMTLIVASVSPLVDKLTRVDGDKIVYYIIPYGKGNLKRNDEYQVYWKQINNEVTPDVVHIYGTEFSDGQAYMKACGTDNVVISIQGLTYAVSKYYHSGITKWDVLRNITIRDILRGSIIADKRRFRKRSRYETDMLKMAKHVIGRTSWDKAMVWSVNSDIQYHFCNETLRDEFYDGSLWNYEKCTKYTIFLSQASYPFKGLHQLLKAMPIILKYYPGTQIRIAGQDITKCENIKDVLRLSGYGLYISRMIKRYGLEKKIHFVGTLNAAQMKDEYLACNVFVCPSSIENSPNSLGEAQILGVPCIASYVGGIPDLMMGDEDNLYRFDDVEMLANKVCRIFDNHGDRKDISCLARLRYDKEENCKSMIAIYQRLKSCSL